MRGTAAANQAAAWFAECYGAKPEGVWHAPGRVNLIGEHTDYNDGFVLPFAVGRGTLAAAARRADEVLELRSRQAPDGGVAVPLRTLEPGAVTGWAAYPAGVAWALSGAGHPITGASVAIDSDLPQGAGLSSSAALECAVALALTQLAGLEVALPELAALAQRAENDFVGVPCGIMDQFASLLCQAGHALLLDCRSQAGTPMTFDPAAAGMTVMIIDTRVRHKLAGGEYANRRRECAKAARALGVSSLRDITDGPAAIVQLADPLLRRRAWHVFTENSRVEQAAGVLRRGDLSAAGPLLTASHISLRDDFEVSWPEADVTVDATIAAGALGARMMGGGFGGSVLGLAPRKHVADICTAVRKAFADHRWSPPSFLEAVPADGARRVQ